MKHLLVPKHEKLSDAAKKKLLEQYSMDFKHLPKIFSSDPALKSLDVVEGDVIKVTRSSPTSGSSVFYRGVIKA